MRKPIALIPAHNEATQIAKVVASALKYLPVLVVDDGSSDNTARLAEQAGATVIRQTPNQGKGQALRTGFKYALENHAALLVTMDGDGQHDPEEIPLFLSNYNSHPKDLIVGMRDFSRMPFSRRLANSLGRMVLSLAIGQDIPDNQSGYRMISDKLMKLMLLTDEDGFEFEVDMLILAIKNNLRIDWIPIKTIYVGGSSHIKPFQHVLKFLRISLKAWKMIHKKDPFALSSEHPHSNRVKSNR